jgi:hypothetical protein
LFRKAKRLGEESKALHSLESSKSADLPKSDNGTLRVLLYQICVIALVNLVLIVLVIATEPGFLEVLAYLTGISFLFIGLYGLGAIREAGPNRDTEGDSADPQRSEYSKTVREVPMDDILRYIRKITENDPSVRADVLRNVAAAHHEGRIEKVEATTEIWKEPVEKS